MFHFFWKDWRDSESKKRKVLVMCGLNLAHPHYIDNLWHTLQVSSQPSFYSSIKLCGGFNLTIWWFPEIEVPPNYTFNCIFHIINQQFLDTPIYETPPMVTKTESTPDVPPWSPSQCRGPELDRSSITFYGNVWHVRPHCGIFWTGQQGFNSKHLGYARLGGAPSNVMGLSDNRHAQNSGLS